MKTTVPLQLSVLLVEYSMLLPNIHPVSNCFSTFKFFKKRSFVAYSDRSAAAHPLPSVEECSVSQSV